MYNELLNSFSVKLKMLMKEKHVTGVELGKIVNVSQPNVSNWVRGYSLPRTDKFYVIAKYFNVSSDWLLGLSKVRERV